MTADAPSTPIHPRVVYWDGPAGYTVCLNEDGVFLKPGSIALEEPELLALWRVVTVAMDCRDAGAVPVPAPQEIIPYAQERIARAADDAARAVKQAVSREYPPF